MLSLHNRIYSVRVFTVAPLRDNTIPQKNNSQSPPDNFKTLQVWSTVNTVSPAELTPVSSVMVDYTCTNHSAQVRWSPVFGADSYKATAMSENGTMLTCTSQGTSCDIIGLSCGQTYLVHVTPISENCKNTVNNTWATFQTGETIKPLRH